MKYNKSPKAICLFVLKKMPVKDAKVQKTFQSLPLKLWVYFRLLKNKSSFRARQKSMGRKFQS